MLVIVTWSVGEVLDEQEMMPLIATTRIVVMRKNNECIDACSPLGQSIVLSFVLILNMSDFMYIYLIMMKISRTFFQV